MSRFRITSGFAIAAAALLSVGMALALAPAAAGAGIPTSIRFTTTGPVDVGFGEDWVVALLVDSSYEGGPTLNLETADGTVDVYISGIGGAYATGLPIQSDGHVYVSQPAAQPLLPAGTHNMTAIFNPTSGGYYASSQTEVPLVITVSALEVAPQVEVGYDPAVSERPVITASIAGPYVEATGGAPAGTWHFVVTGSEQQPVFDSEFAQVQGSTEPLRVEIDSALLRGESYTVVSTFTPVDELAGGVTVGTLADSVFETPSGTLGEALTAAVPIPLWLGILLLLLLLGLAAAAIIIGVRLSGRNALPATDGAPMPQRLPGDPLNVEVVSLDEMGLPAPATIPELLPEGQGTKKLPTSTTWLLSDVEPATGLPDASEAPTERIDAVSSAKLDAELSDSGSTNAPTEKLSTEETKLTKDS